jgi:hypothetical protein
MDIAATVGAERLREIMADLASCCVGTPPMCSMAGARWTSSPVTGSWQCSVRPVALEDHAVCASLVTGGHIHAIETDRHAAEATNGALSGSSGAAGATASGESMHMSRCCPTRELWDAIRCWPVAPFSIEPMLTLGPGKPSCLDDKCIGTTVDESRAAHWEHTVP